MKCAFVDTRTFVSTNVIYIVSCGSLGQQGIEIFYLGPAVV